MNEWNIQSRAHTCQECGRHFADKQPYHTVLFDERREVHRIDLCEACWVERHSDGASHRPGFVSHWQGIYEAPPAAAPDPIKKENAETLLRRIIELNDPRYGAASYILAVMLERKRVLKVKEQFSREGHRVFIYEQPRTADLFTITDPNLQLNQLDQVQHDVASLLENGLPGDHSLASAGAGAGSPAGGDAATAPDNAAPEVPGESDRSNTAGDIVEPVSS